MNRIPRSDAQVRLRTLSHRPRADRRSWVIRPDDLLVLDFELVNLIVQPGEGETPARLATSGTAPAYLIVTFPPQHLSEIAYFTTVPAYPVAKGHPDDPDRTSGKEPPDPEPLDPAPVQAVVSGWSRLVFRVPNDRLPIDWNLESLLLAMRSLELSVPANALPPAPKRAGPTLGSLLEAATLGKFAALAADIGGIQAIGVQR